MEPSRRKAGFDPVEGLPLGSKETEFKLPPGGVIGVEDDPCRSSASLTARPTTSPGSHSGSLRPRAAIEKADDESDRIGDRHRSSRARRARDALLQIETDAGSRRSFSSRSSSSTSCSRMIAAISWAEMRRRRPIPQYPTSLINKPMAFPDMRKSSSFCRFGIRRLQGSYDLSLEPTCLRIEQQRQAFGPRLRHRSPGQIVRQREAKFVAIGAALDVLHSSSSGHGPVAR